MLAEKLQEAAGNGLASTLYVDDVFSTYLYTGNGSTQTITNGIDLAGQGGMVWLKFRAGTNTASNELFDTVRGVNKLLISNGTQAENTPSNALNSFNSNGFTLGGNTEINFASDTYASWTFRKAAKFFDVVTYTGTGANRTIAHNLGIAPGMVIVKRTDTTGNWQVYSNGLTSAAYSIQLNLTAAQASATTVWNSTAPTSSVFSVGTDATVNASGGTYVAYLFAHNTASDGIIQCGSFTTDGSGNATVNLGWEPQYVLYHGATSSSQWEVLDSMRGFSLTGSARLFANLANSEVNNITSMIPTATGFATSSSGYLNASSTYIYLAIRRPNKPPTSGTQVFGLNARTGTGANATVTGGQTVDAVLIKNRGSADNDLFASRLTGTGYLETSSTSAEVAAGTTILQANPWDVMDGVKVGTTSTITNASANTFINYFFKRAPGFMDVVCYTGTGSATTQAHNLGVVPELMIVKSRSTTGNWQVAVVNPVNSRFYVGDSAAYEFSLNNIIGWGAVSFNVPPYFNETMFKTNTFWEASTNGTTYVAYLFATLAGISKVGSYTGNGTTQTINCGFTGGARFVLIKRTDSTGDWYVFDTARGMTTLTDPYLLLDSTAAEVATLGAVTSVTTGFAVNAAIVAAINTNAASYIFLAIA